MGAYESACDTEFVKRLVERIKEDYSSEDELWEDAANFGRFVIEELGQLEDLEFEGEAN